MNGTHILEHFSNQLAARIAEAGKTEHDPVPLNIDPWLAMSLLQKAIRRGHVDWAMGAAATLLRSSPDRLWRRLGVTAYEDIGVADFDLIALTTVALKGKRLRADLGGEWAVASYLIERMCQSTKCRAGDDLIVIAEFDPDLDQPRLDLTFKPLPHLIKTMNGSGDLGERAIAAWYGVDTDRCQSDRLRIRRGEPGFVFDALCDAGYPNTTVEVCREGLRKINELLPVLIPMLEREAERHSGRITEDGLPDEELINGVPCWAYDMHTRAGKRAIAMMVNRGNRFSTWYRKHVEERYGPKPVGNLLFRVESGLVDRRYRWKVGDDLKARADVLSCGLDPNLAAEGLELLRECLPDLNEARRDVTRSNFR